MSTVICQGCGQAFAVPEGYSRNKIQCPGCGVICPVPEGGGQRAAAPAPRAEAKEARRPARSVEEDAAAWLDEPAPAPRPARRQEPAPPRPARREEPVLAAEEVPLAEAEAARVPVLPRTQPEEPAIRCRHCGRPVRRQYECAVCDLDLDKPLPLDPEDGGAKPAAGAPVGVAPRSLELEEDEELEDLPLADEDEEVPSPYATAERDKPRCRKCRKEMELDAVVCMSCGFNLRTRKKAKRTFVPVERFWEADLTLTTRLAILGGVMGFHLLLTLGGLAAGNVAPFIAAGVPLLLILCFVLGSYDTTRITRDARGRVTLYKQWRFFFVPAPVEKYDCRGYLGVLVGGWNDSGIMEWVICILLLCVGLVPAFVWWYLAIYQNHYHVSLAEDHGRAAVTVYRGRSEEQMHEIAKVLTDATGLRILT